MLELSSSLRAEFKFSIPIAAVSPGGHPILAVILSGQRRISL